MAAVTDAHMSWSGLMMMLVVGERSTSIVHRLSRRYVLTLEADLLLLALPQAG
jgi:hypothetical protein